MQPVRVPLCCARAAELGYWAITMDRPEVNRKVEQVIITERLELVPANLELVRAALGGHAALGEKLCAAVPATWPPEFLDRAAFEYTIARLSEGPEQVGWWLHFVVLRACTVGERALIGSAGYKGPPSPDGTVEVGYGIVREYQRRGFATEALGGLLAHAFQVSEVQRVVAETLPELAGSIGVLRKFGFRLIGDDSEPGTIRFELTRAEYRGE
ncbi:MAG: GNAT family N-acetyltransferase [Nitrososphaera sp.]|nr:GNAT family N-acetyltransferase [Nitrososphaera sp.]